MKLEDLEPGADVPETRKRSWEATFICDRNCGSPRGECPGVRRVQVNIERVAWDQDRPYYYVSEGAYHVGAWPGTSSAEWIEYIAPDSLVELHGNLWWRSWDETIDGFRYAQITKGDACNSSSIATDSR